MPRKEEAGRETAWEPSKGWRRLTGGGCFGKPATLINMLHRVMAQYERGAGHMDELGACPSPVGCAARHLMHRLSLECYASRVVSPPIDAQGERVTGFFFYMGQDRTRISVYTQNNAMLPLRSD